MPIMRLMNKVMKMKRFTLSLPENVHNELTRMAEEKGISSKEVIIKSLKLGLIAFTTDNDPTKELILRENVGTTDSTKETKLILI